MNSENAQIYDLQKEWRAIVLDKLTTLELNQAELKNNISDMKTTFANQAELAALKTKVEVLESFKSKAIGAMIALQLVGGVLAYIISFLTHK